jgi:hypothetical protein
MGWQQLRGRNLDDWLKFQRAVEEVFGLTRQQLEDQFFALEPAPDKASPAFVMRVEVARRNVGVDASQAYHAFAKRFLSAELKGQLD